MAGHFFAFFLLYRIRYNIHVWKPVLHPDCEAELKRLKGTNNKLLSKVIYDLRLLREFGLGLLSEDRVKKLTDEIFELRTKQGSNINRVLFGVREKRVLVLVASFVKKSGRTPKGMIELAEQRLTEWETIA